MEGNEGADTVTKVAAVCLNGRRRAERFTSLAHINRTITERKLKENMKWDLTHSRCSMTHSRHPKFRRGSTTETSSYCTDIIPAQVETRGGWCISKADSKERLRPLLGVHLMSTNGPPICVVQLSSMVGLVAENVSIMQEDSGKCTHLIIATNGPLRDDTGNDRIYCHYRDSKVSQGEGA